MLKLLKNIKNQLLRFKRKVSFGRRFDWRLVLQKLRLPLCVLFGFGLLVFLIIWIRNLPAKAPNFKRNSESSIYSYEAKNKNFESGIGLKDQKPIVSFSVPSGQNITFLYQTNDEINPQLNSQDKNLTFTGIENGVDLKYQTLPTGIKEEIVLNQARQKEKDANVFIFDANFQGAFPKESIKGFASPVFYDENNEYLFHFEKPFAIDASGNRTDNVSLQIEDKANSKIPDVKRSINEESPYLIRLTVDQAWLDDPARVYPITIDPTIVHDTSSEFSAGSFNRAKDTGSGASPVLETYYQELATDEYTVGLWHLNELAGGGDAIDYSGNNNTGTAVGTTVVDGVVGKARVFNGSSDYINAGNNAIEKVSGEITVEAWIKTSASATYRGVIGKMGNGGGQYGYLLRMAGSGLAGAAEFGISSTGSNFVNAIGTTLINDNSWHHIAGVFIPSSSIQIYVDGVLQTTNTTSIPASIFNSTANVSIGSSYSAPAEFFSGSIDEARISNVARSAEEIKASASRRPYSTYTSDIIDLTGVNSWNFLSWLENGVATGDGETLKDATGLIAQWNLNNTSGTTATNNAGSCGASCNGTLNNFTLTSSQDQDNGAAMATGGTITYSGGYTIHTFTGSGTFTPSVAMNVETLVVGGGGGGANTGSGGGAGGYVHNTAFAVTATAYPITVGGGGGGGATTAAPGANGGDSIFSTITAIGGGGGRSHGGCAGAAGGSGSGGPISTTCTATGGTGSQGSNGGAGYLQGSWTGGSGGGGGAGGPGAAGGNTAGMGNGGVGLSNSISGTAVFYAGGGGGGEVNGSYVGTGGNGGGGTAVLNAAGGNGTANTGGGGAGGSYTGTYFNGGNGGSGIVIIRYPTKPSGWTANNKKWGTGALQFDGLNDYVSIPDNNSLSFGNAGTDTPFSISTWVKPSYLAGTSDGNWIISKRDAGSGDEYQLVFWQGKIHASLFTSNANSITQNTNKTWDAGYWYHITMTYDGSKTAAGIKIYVNGKLEPSTASSNGSYTGMNNSANPVLIGKASWNTGLEFDGIIDSTQIYSRALTAAEILSNYNVGHIELQTRVGSDASPDDGSWETWKPTTTEAFLNSLDNYSPLSCTGGEILDGGRIHKFTTSDTFTCTGDGKVEVLVVAGGGGGGTNMGGGGGGGGVIYNPSVSITNGTPYTVTVGAGGNGAPAGTVPGHPNVAATNGGNSVFGSLTAIGGGAGGSSPNTLVPSIANGSAGGSGGGASGYNSDASAIGAHAGGAGTAGQGFRGGAQGNAYYSGGGGGAGGAGADGNNKANGGIGYYSDILGEGYYWGGGGGGGGYTIAGGNGGNGGGGGGAAGTTYGGSGINNGSPGGGGCTVCWNQRPGGDGGPNTGGGGGGGGHYFSSNKGGNGGSGIVIVRLSPTSKDTTIKTEGTGSQKLDTNPIKADKNTVGMWHLDETGGTGSYLESSTSVPFATGGVVTYSGGYTIHTFYESGTFVVNGSGSVETLIVAGGGGGGSDMGGGGGGGGVITNPSVAVSPNSYTITVGAGGAGSPGVYASTPASGSNGGNSSFNSLVAIGGGGGGSGHRTDAPYVGGNALVGGSGGGSAARYMYSGAPQSLGAAGTVGQGTRGGNAPSTNTNYYAGGGGGAGGNAEVDAVNGTRAGNGGPGIASSILGTTYYFGAGGGGAGHTGGPAGNGGLGGGGGASTWAAPSTAGAAGTGGIGVASPGSVAAVATVGGYAGTSTGSGGGGGNHQGNGGAGGSGIVVIRYPTNYSPVTINNNGTPNGTSSTEGINKKGRNFSGGSDYISISYAGSQNFPKNEITTDFWIKTTDSTDGIISYSASSSDNEFLIYDSSNIKIYRGASGLVTTGVSINDGVWHHIATTWKGGDGEVKLYKDGVNVYTGSLASSTSISGNGILMFGQEQDSVGGGLDSSQAFNGIIDEVRISNVARSATEIAESYRAGRDSYVNLSVSSTDLSSKKLLPFYIAADRPGSYLTATVGESAYANYQADSNTVGLWHLDETSGTGAYVKDSAGIASNGTPTNTVSVNGKTGKARNFNGTSSTIMIPANTAFNFTGDYTLEAWVRPTTMGVLQGVMGKYSDNGWGLNINSTDKVNFGMHSCSNFDGNTTLVANKWYHVVGVFKSSGNEEIYVNGVLDGTGSLTSGNCGADASNFVIGEYRTTTNIFYGDIDEVRLSNIARSAEEIRQAYEVGLRSHSITIDFAAYLVSSNLIDDVNDKSFNIDTTPYGTINKGSKLYKGDKIIVRENYNGTEYIAQGDVVSIDEETGATTVNAWDSGSTFPGVGFTPQADVFKWQREYWNISAPLDSQLDTITQISLRLTSGNEGRTVWLDDFKSSGDYLSNPLGSTLTNATGNRYFQYRAIISSDDEAVSPSLSSVTLDYAANSIPAIPSLNSPADTATNQSSLPTLLTTTTDADGDYLRYKIQLCTNLAMTTSCQTFDQTSSQTGWSGQNAQTSTAYTSGTQASYTLQTDLLANTTYYWRSYAIDPVGTGIWSATQATPYSFTTSAAPDAPTVLYTEGTENTIAVNDLTPEFSAIHNDSNGDSANYYEIEVNTASDFSGTVMWDSGKQSMTSTANGVRSPNISYAGTALNFNGTTYYWRIRFWDIFNLMGAWSTVNIFSMNNTPNIPSLDVPIQGNLNIYFKPTLLTTTTDADGDYLRYKIQLCTNLAMTTSCQTFDQTSSQTGWSGQNAQTSTAYTSGTQASYTLQTDLLANTTYYWRSYAIDPVGGNVWSSTQSTPHNFTTMNAPLPASACFIQESIADDQLQIIWTDNASNENFYEVQRSVDGGAWTTFQTALPANTVNLTDNTISSGHTYQYRIAPYFTGPFYSAWCTASSLNLGVGLFNLEGINASGLNFN